MGAVDRLLEVCRICGVDPASVVKLAAWNPQTGYIGQSTLQGMRGAAAASQGSSAYMPGGHLYGQTPPAGMVVPGRRAQPAMQPAAPKPAAAAPKPAPAPKPAAVPAAKPTSVPMPVSAAPASAPGNVAPQSVAGRPATAATPPVKPAIASAAPAPTLKPAIAPIRASYSMMPGGSNVSANAVSQAKARWTTPTSAMAPSLSRPQYKPMFSTGLNLQLPTGGQMQPSISMKRGSAAIARLVKLAQVMGPPQPRGMIQRQLQRQRDTDERRLNAQSSANRWSRVFHNPLSLVGMNGGINAHNDSYDAARAELQARTGAGNWLQRADDIGALRAGYRDWRATGRAHRYMNPGHGDQMAALADQQREALNFDALRRRNRMLASTQQLKPPQQPTQQSYNPYPAGYKPALYTQDYYSARYD